MPKIEVDSRLPEQTPGGLVAWIDLGKDLPTADEKGLRQHPGWRDVERRRKAGEISSPYLSASDLPLLVLPGASAKHWPVRERLKTLAADAFGAARDRQCSSLVILLDGIESAVSAGDAAEGIALIAYKFEKYKKPKKGAADPHVTLLVPAALAKAAKAEIAARIRLCESVNRARNLVNEPGSVCTPALIEAEARKVAKTGKLKIDVLNAARLKKEGYEGLLAVGRGGSVDPRMIVLSYNPPGARKGFHLGLLGKGVTFDTGGVSIKPSAGMWEMKGDMSGAAATLYAMEAIAAIKPKVRVTGIIVTAQNYVDEDSIVPGDVIKARNGKFIHVDNTDAEGRLILTDGLWRAGEEKVTHLVDIATLTGAVVRALGPALSGAFGNDCFADSVVEIAGECGEPCFRLPMVEEYADWMKTDVADINNITGKTEAGAITAALFLREFVPEGIHWTHLDIAGTFINSAKKKYLGPGGTGVMVRSLTAIAKKMAEDK